MSIISIDDFDFKISELKLDKTHPWVVDNIYKLHSFVIDSTHEPHSEFINYYLTNCSKCGVESFALKTSDNNLLINNTHVQYQNLTCDEIIIKKIIE